ncbi:basic helix-loop-helix (bHLH) DNA-bindingsuperfamily protein [Striga asiatica]|uniref:Basic helix-loop-helix (BHLH) DNA-bindingsuperfamily protein n=1 Tax=Striga asiatica TaxID=4170 RepID=A0A5A7P2B3_STRAF|nr:basic helix-loop-helix (bHLH) DNA-bindingsuperfamily protein [Striga asiatica]
MDAVPEYKNKRSMLNVIGPQLNDKIMEFLMDEGVAFQEDYQTNGKWNPRNHERSALRRRREHLSVAKKLLDYNIDKQPTTSGEAFNFAESIKNELQRMLLPALIKVRTSLNKFRWQFVHNKIETLLMQATAFSVAHISDRLSEIECLA